MEIQKSLTAIILAAGKGSRMNSGGLSKVLHEVDGVTMLDRVLQTVKHINPKNTCLVLGKDWADFSPITDKYQDLAICIQEKLNGTAGAVAACSCFFKNLEPIRYAPSSLKKGSPVDMGDYVLICYGDTPMLKPSLLEEFIEVSKKNKSHICVLGMKVPDPKGYGRLVTNSRGGLKKIVEEKDACAEEKKINLCNSGIIIARTKILFDSLHKVKNKNAQGEYYLTDTIALIKDQTNHVDVFVTDDWHSFIGVNTKQQLLDLEKRLNERKI